eukprot:TRINITY_DN4767_c0_g1_i2.p1 TRINITY_DN4767_c0_g1~~TRINITY_DN4767_c0_g1_i2.p1  ORF type:complete len:443 (-),score=61.49 TRINITY_DN4767_c0_g1_i2:12-1340(-)
MDIDNFFFNLFVGLAISCAAAFWFTKQKSENQESEEMSEEKKRKFKSFQLNYLIIYYIVMTSDWLQGPYVYALYESYGFNKQQIGELFIAGFSSSLIFGTIAGGIADKVGRKSMCIFFGIIYSCSCVTKLFADYYILMLGRLFGGIATSLLFSSFESWMVDEHKKNEYPNSKLSETFHYATLGNGVVAILSGLIASYFASRYGFVSPFVVAIGFLIASAFMISISWSENYGDSKIEVIATFSNAIVSLSNDKKIMVLGLMQSLFEASMYTFVFMWSPAIIDSLPKNTSIPYGLIFACFMVCIMIGSNIFSFLIRKSVRPETLISFIFFISTCCFCVSIFFSKEFLYLIASFLVFETCCGLFFPCMGTLRGNYIDEKSRSSIMSFFRMPLNAIVVAVLLKVSSLNNETVFAICSTLLSVSFVLSYTFNFMVDAGSKKEEIPNN